MGWGTRLRNTVSHIIAPPSPVTYPQATKHSVDLNSLKTMMSTKHGTPFEEMLPGLSQPVWGPEINTVGAYSREGYTSRTRDVPKVPFRTMAITLQQDEDVRVAMQQLTAQVTGGAHHISAGDNPELTKYFEKFTENIEFDIMDTEVISELLWYGNSFWKPRMGIANVRNANDLMHIPISSAVAVWWDRQRQAYKYEFRGTEYQGYHNPGEIIHFTWNKINASVFGSGAGDVLLSGRRFVMHLNDTDFVELELPHMLDRKYTTQHNMQAAENRYISSNIYKVLDSDETQRAALQAQLQNKTVGQDLVTGASVEVQELGSNSRNFNSEQFTEMTQAPIFKGLGTTTGKQAGDSQQTYSNAETSKEEDQSAMSAFIISAKIQFKAKLFKPWYEANPYIGMDYISGVIPMFWDDTKFELNFGQMEKKDLSTEDMLKAIELYMNSGMGAADPKILNNMFKQVGLNVPDPEIIDQMYNDPNGVMAMQQAGIQPNPEQGYELQNDIGGGEIYPQFNNQTMGESPMNDDIYNSMAQQERASPFVPSGYFQSDQSQSWNSGKYDA